MPFSLEELKKRIEAIRSRTGMYGPGYFGITAPPTETDNTYRLHVCRTALSTIAFGAILLKNKDLTFDQLLDENSNAEIRMQAGKEVSGLFGSVDRDERGRITDGENTARFEKFAAEAFVAVMEEGTRYINSLVNGDFGPESFLDKKNERLLAACVLIGDAMQNVNVNTKNGSVIGDTARQQEAVIKKGDLDAYLFDKMQISTSFSFIDSLPKLADELIEPEKHDLNAAALTFSNILIQISRPLAGAAEVRKDTNKSFCDGDVLMAGFTGSANFSAASAGRDYFKVMVGAFASEEGRKKALEEIFSGKLFSRVFAKDGTLKPMSELEDFADEFTLENARDLKKHFDDTYSYEFYGFTKEENTRLLKMGAPFGIDVRLGLGVLTMSELLKQKFSFDQILDPGRKDVRAALEQTRKDITERFEKGCTEDPEAQKEFASWIADSYINVGSEIKAYTGKAAERIRSVKDLVHPDNKNVLPLTQYLQQIIQDVDKSKGPGGFLETVSAKMGRDAYESLRDFQIQSNTILSQMQNTLNGVLLFAGKDGSSVNINEVARCLSSCAVLKSMNKDSWTDPGFALSMFSRRDGVQQAMALDDRDNAEMMSGFLKDPKARRKLAGDMLTGKINEVFTMNEDGTWKSRLGEYVEQNSKPLRRESLTNQLKKEAQSRKVPFEQLLSESVAVMQNGVRMAVQPGKDAAETVDTIVSQIEEGKEVFLFRDNGRGQQGYSLSAEGTSAKIAEEPSEFLTEQQRKMLKDLLKPLEKAVMDTGVTRRDSDEFTEMRESLIDAMKTVETTATCSVINDAIRDMREKADAYYMAKLDADHNSRRSARFTAAAQLREFAGVPVKSLKEVLTEAVAAKAAKAYLENKANDPNEAVGKKYEKILGDPEKFQNAVESMLDMPQFKRMVAGKTEAQLKSMTAKKGSDLYKQMRSMKEPVQKNGPVNVK